MRGLDSVRTWVSAARDLAEEPGEEEEALVGKLPS